MERKLTTAMEHAWAYLWDVLFCEKTNLFYDYVTHRDPERRFEHLPHPEEIRAQFPNPCGWGTGMEDSMLNAGSVMDVLRLRHTLAGDSDAPARAEAVLAGMRLCAGVHGTPGFLARSVSPRDGESCYANSSRDQFTLCAYGAWRFLHAFPNATAAAQNGVRTLLSDLAAYCDAAIRKESGFNLLRLDGQPGLVSKMLECDPHEALRLPMIYAAAWDATGNPHWLEQYRRYADPGLEQTLRLDPKHNWWDIELCQMQISLALCAAVEPEIKEKEKYREALHNVANLAIPYMRESLRKAQTFTGDWDTLNPCWRLMNMRVREEILHRPSDSALYGGYGYVLPKFPAEYETPYSLLRAAGNYLYTIALDPAAAPDKDLMLAFAEIARQPDYAAHGSDAPINLLHGYWLTRERGWLDGIE